MDGEDGSGLFEDLSGGTEVNQGRRRRTAVHGGEFCNGGSWICVLLFLFFDEIIPGTIG